MELNPILLFVLLFGTTLLFNIPLAKLKIPPIIGYILTGVVIANLFTIEQHQLEIVAEVGIVLLMFLIGLEFSLEKLKVMKKEVFLFGTLEMIIVSLFFGTLFYILGSVPFKIAIIIGGALALSSTAIVLKLLNEKREIGKPYGRVVLGILLFQDIAVIPLLIAISILANQDAHLLPILVKTSIAFVGLGVFIVIYGKFVAPHIIRFATKTRSDEIFLVAVLVVALFASLVAHFLGLSYTLGAFLGGMVLSETPYKYEIEAKLISFRDLLLGIFFISVGLNIELHFVVSHLLEVVGLVIGIMGAKIGLIYAILRLTKVPNRVAVKSAFALSQIGEFAFVIFSLLLGHQMVEKTLIQLLMVTAVISMILTPLIISHIFEIADFFDKEGRNREELYCLIPAEVKNHIVIIGYDQIGQWVAEKLTRQGIPYVAIEKLIDLVEEGVKNGHNVVFGNGADGHLLKELAVDEARAVIVTTQHQKHTQLIVENIRKLNSKIKIIVLTQGELEEEEYLEKENIYTIDSNKLIAKTLIDTILRELEKEK
ncbi:MAG: sodium:proton exchanger [Epsilonproteobacteria bacterium]|nr:sodium:proton exchanger [Campylobacterota bacterium]NPA88922.1 sodium:proton exchanger [Campylobacterota bacterium]